MERRQAKLVNDAQLQTQSWKYHQAIAQCFDQKLQVTGSGVPSAIEGKVRDRIELNDQRLALVTTDRQSGFDRHLALVPFKGAVLNLTSAFWFEQTRDIIPNHVIAVPHPYVTISRKCQPFPIEFVVRYVPNDMNHLFCTPFLLSGHCSDPILQILHDRIDVNLHLEELSKWCSKLLWT